MKDLTVAFITKSNLGKLEIAVNSFRKLSTEIPILILQNNCAEDNRVKELAFSKEKNIYICETPEKYNCSQLWNLLLMLTNTRYVMICNDDISFNEGILEQVEILIKEEYNYILCNHHHCFVIDKKCICVLGWYDEKIEGGYHADADFIIRIMKSGGKIGYLPSHIYIDHNPEYSTKKDQWDNPLIAQAYISTKWYLTEDTTNEEVPFPINNIALEGKYAHFLSQKIPDIDLHPSFTFKFINKCQSL